MSVYGSAVEFVKELYKMQKLMIKERLNFGARALMINIMLAANASPRQMSVEITDGELSNIQRINSLYFLNLQYFLNNF